MWMKYFTYLLPYRALSNNDRFVIWGYGRIGKALVKQWETSHFGALVAVVDAKEPRDKEKLPCPFHAPEYLKDHQDFTKIILAIRDAKIVESIVQQLHSWGISQGKILTQPDREGHRIEVPDRYIKLPSSGYVNQMREYFRPWNVRGGVTFVRVGNAHDGGYVMLDDFHSGGIAYSFGISNDVTWDRDMAVRGYDVYMYDHTIDELPEHRPAFHFFKKGISGAQEPPCLDTLPHYVAENKHDGNCHMILKMDVEGAEWKALLACPDALLQCFDQIAIEYHDVILPTDGGTVLATLEKLDRTHAPVHVHANNCGYVCEFEGHAYSQAIEVTYANRSIYDCAPGGEWYTELDAPCNPSWPEMYFADVYEKQES